MFDMTVVRLIILNFSICVPMLLLIPLIPGRSNAVEYDCVVEQKFDSERSYSPTKIKDGQFSVIIEETGSETFLSRCSFSSTAGKKTCDRYKVDRIAYDENVSIKKYYIFSSQFDVQLFSDLFFVENNGRAGIAFGNCKLVSP